MHSRSPYQFNPNFTILAQAYPDLKPYLTGNTLDFHNDAAQRALTRALLHRDFNLTIDLPSNRLCPPVPNRLNYVLWIQDIVRAHEETLRSLIGGENGVNVHGIDIGTGASAIYPLLACSLEPHWQFMATELDPESYTYACTNVRRNKLESRVQVFKVGDDEVRNGQVDMNRTKKGGSPASTVADMDQAENEDPGTTGNMSEGGDGSRRPLPFGFDGLFRLHVGGEDTEDRQGQQGEKTLRGTPTRPSEKGHPRLQVEFTMCNPPFYASAAEVEEGFASKEAGPLGVCTGAPMEMITPGGEARFVGQMVRESAGASSSWDHELPGKPGPSPSYQQPVTQEGSVKQPRTSIASGGKHVLEKPAPSGRSNKRRRIGSEGPVGGGPIWNSRWYTSMLGKMGSVVEVVRELGACGISNYAVTEFVQGQTRRWAVGWSLGGFRLPDSITRIENPNPTLRQLMPPRNTLRFPHLAGAGQTTGPGLGLLRHILASIDGVRVYESVDVDGGTRPGFPAGTPSHVQSDDLRHVPVPVPVLVRASGDTWSRSARRNRKRKREEQARDGSTATSSGGPAPHPPPPRGFDIASAALVCSVLWDRDRDRGGGLDVRWVYGYDRALFESFASHVASKVGAWAALGGAP